MSRRRGYLIALLILLGAELLIGAFVRDAFIRPYGGDILVAVLLCCMWRCIFPTGSPWMPLWVLGLCAGVEFLQLLNLPDRLGFESTALAIALGTSFDWKDLVCYSVGCAIFAGSERWILKKCKHK